MQRRARARVAQATVMLLAGLIAWPGAGCRRTLDGAPCPCVDNVSWTCCEGVCVPVGSCSARPEAGAITSDAHSDARDAHSDGWDAHSDARDAHSDARDAHSDARDAHSDARDAQGGRDAHADARDALTTPDAAGDASVDGPSRPPVDDSPVPEICTVGGWCWTHPLPTGETLVHVWAPKADDIWVAGDGGALLRWDGSKWSALRPPMTSISTVWGSSDEDVWLGGFEGLWHWDGSAFSLVPPTASPTTRGVYAIWGSTPQDVWAVGGWFSHWDGQAWTPLSPDNIDNFLLDGSVQGLWGSSATDVYAASYTTTVPGKVLHWDGHLWSTVPRITGGTIAGTGPDDVLVGSVNQLWRLHNTAWSPAPDPPQLALVQAHAGLVGGLDAASHLSWWDGTAWSAPSAAAPVRLQALWADGRNDAWAAGAGGAVASWDGTGWTKRLPKPLLASDAIKVVSGTASDDVWAATRTTLLHFDGAKWSVEATADTMGGAINDVWACAPDDPWVLGADGLVHRRNSAGWYAQVIPMRGAGNQDLIAISGTSATDVWIIRGGDTVMHFDDKDGWTSAGTTRGPLTRVWAAAPGEAYFAGSSLAHWIGGMESDARLTFPGTVSLVTGSGPNDVWAAIDYYAFHYDGSKWSNSVSFEYDDIDAMASRNGQIWLAVNDEVLGHSRLWNPTVGGANLIAVPVRAAWIAPDGTAFLGGDRGALLRRRPPAAPAP